MFDLEKVSERFNRFIRSAEAPAISKHGNTYYVFKYYRIENGNGKYDLYKQDEYVDTVMSSAAAMSWCKAQASGDWQLAKKLILADQRVATKTLELEMRKKHYKESNDKETKDTLLILVNEDIYKLKQLKHNLKKLIKQTKYIKIKGFDNELN